MENLESNLFEGTCYAFDSDFAIFENCKMLVDFGPAKIGSNWETINIAFQNKRVIEFIDASGTIVHTVPYKIVPDLD